MTPADRLRAAATLLRERAGAAREWNADVQSGDSLHLWVPDYDPSDPSGQTAMQRLVGGADAPWSDYIALMSPPVALRLADLLDDLADMHAATAVDVTRWPSALAVADAVLGDALAGLIGGEQ